jgi:3-methylcrotonyl-CoA carboxylase alpha subunit
MKKVLIANRGEIACRVIRACRSLGLMTVAVFSEADERALHAELADEAYPVGPAPARKSYLDQAAILKAAGRSGADAVHPGYGFLSESPTFARAVETAGMTWIGPRAKTIEDMGDKERARMLAKSAGVPVLPGSPRFAAGDAGGLAQSAEAVGYPLLVKAAGGGGGIGMRLVEGPERLGEVVEATQKQAERTFGDGTVYLERFVARARHVEVQVFGLGDGRVVTFPERDCSVQRRFQKVIEESPAPGLSPATREAMRKAAEALAVQERYRGAGTVEFVLDGDSEEFFFLEMNTRIQVEHPVTEMATGVDLVELQLRLAAGDGLGALADAHPAAQGHAIEARIYAERPEKGFLPSPGHLERCELPEQGHGLRIDGGIRQGDTITAHYDPMIAKLIAVGDDRQHAIERLRAGLAQCRISGVATNLDFLLNLLADEAYRKGGVSTRFVEENLRALTAVPADHA